MGNSGSSGGGGGGGAGGIGPSATGRTGAGMGGVGRSYDGAGSFGAAFAQAHRDHGAGSTFSFRGNSYSTNRADGRDLRSEARSNSASIGGGGGGGTGGTGPSATGRAGAGMGGVGRSYDGAGSFGAAFAQAHRDHGAGSTFSFRGNSYSTNRADGRDLRSDVAPPSKKARSGVPAISKAVAPPKANAPAPAKASAPPKANSPSPAKAVAAAKANAPAPAKVMTLPTGEINALRGMKTIIRAAADKYNLDPNLVAAIISRESAVGKTLDGTGHGDKGNAFGVMQVDKRHHNVDCSNGPTSRTHIEQGVAILAKCIKDVEAKHPKWPQEKQIQGGVAAYNFGVKNVQTQEHIDRGTTGNNYSADVLGRAECIKNNAVFD